MCVLSCVTRYAVDLDCCSTPYSYGSCTSRPHSSAHLFCVYSLFCVSLAFRSAVDWSETWIQGILVFHLSLWLFFIVTRKSFGAQVRGTCSVCELIRPTFSTKANQPSNRQMMYRCVDADLPARLAVGVQEGQSCETEFGVVLLRPDVLLLLSKLKFTPILLCPSTNRSDHLLSL